MLKIILAALTLLLSACTDTAEPEQTRVAALPDAEKASLSGDVGSYTDTLLASASTPLPDSSASRVNNIRLACASVNGSVLYPGGSFSFNSAVGAVTEENGYTDAPVIKDGHKATGCGGGICQVSSTLYMAVLNSGLSVAERHAHSASVPYAPEGLDATVVSGEKDFCFTNNTGNILSLRMWTDGEAVFSEIYQKVLDKQE